PAVRGRLPARSAFWEHRLIMATIRLRLTAAAGLLAGLAGCSGGTSTADKVAAMNPSNIHRLSNLYAAHQMFKNGQGPADEASFKEFVRTFPADKLKMMGIDPSNTGAVFVSDRDGKPFKVRCQVSGGRGASDAVVFEQEGQGGRKQVG